MSVHDTKQGNRAAGKHEVNKQWKHRTLKLESMTTDTINTGRNRNTYADLVI